MLEKIGNTLIVGVKFYGSTGAGITGLTDITTYVYKLTVSGTTITKTTVMNGVNQATANMIEVDRGLYAFPILAADLGQECVVFYQCETATSTVTNKTEAAAYTVGKAGVEYLDYSIQSVDNDVQTTYNAANSASTSAASANTAASLAASRLGAFLGTGTNTVLGFFQALFRANASTPSGIGGTFNPATDSLEAIRDRGDAAWTTGSGSSVEDIVDGIEASPVIDSIYDKTLQIGTANATILTPVAPSGTLVINRGVSMTKWTSMVYDCRLIADFDEATHPVKLFIDYGNGSKLVKTIGVGAILETASAIQVDLAPTLTSAVTRDMPLGSFPAQIVAFTDASAERHIILELTIQVKAPGFDYSASDT